MIQAEALASIDSAVILPFIFLRSRSTRDRLHSTSERLPPERCWIDDHDGEEIGLGQRHALIELHHRLVHRNAHRHRFHDEAEFAANRLVRLVGDDGDAVAERQAGLDAADDDVDRGGEFVG